MKALSVSEFLKFRDVPSCSQRGLITRTLFRARGYTCGNYRTEFDGGLFRLYHYSTCILEVDVTHALIIDYGGYSISDRQALYCAFWRLGLHDYNITLNSNEPPRGLVIWYQDVPMKRAGKGQYTLADLKPEEVDWMKRKRKDVLLRKAAEGYVWHRWAYSILYGQSKPNQKRLTNEALIEGVPFQHARRSGGGRRRWDYDQSRLTKWMEDACEKQSRWQEVFAALSNSIMSWGYALEERLSNCNRRISGSILSSPINFFFHRR